MINHILRELAANVRTNNPLIDGALRVIAAQGEQREQRGDEQRALIQESGDEFEEAKQDFLRALLDMETGVFLILGTKGTGKTALSCRLLDEYGSRGKDLYALGLGKLPPHITEIETLEDLPNGSAVAIDDTNIIFDNRGYFSDAGKLLHRIITLSRQKDLLIIANAQQSAAVNKYLLQADALFLKPQNALVAEYERGALLKLITSAARAFQGMGLEEVRSHAYAVSVSAYLPPFRGLIEYEQPSWYNAIYSKSKSGQ